MRLLHLIDSLATGGAERVAVNLSNDLAERGHDVHLVTTRVEGPLLDEVAPAVHHWSLGRRRTLDVEALRRLRTYLADHRIELVHAHGTSVFTGLAAGLGRSPTPTVYHDHGGAIDARRPLPYRVVARRAAAIVVVNEQLRRWHVERAHASPARCVVLPNFSRLALTPTSRSDDPSAPVQIVAVGNVRALKDYPTLIDAFARVSPSLGAHLAVAGSLVDTDEVSRVRRRLIGYGIEDRVSLLGEVRAIDAVLATADIAVSSSRIEGFPLAVLEYGLAGLAVAATDVGGTAEILDDGRAGILVPPGDPAAMAAALTRLIERPDERTRLGTLLHDHVVSRFDEQRVIDDLELIYGRILSM